MKTPRKSPFSVLAWLATIGLALIIIGLIFRSTYRLTLVSGDSMLPTLRSGDLLLVNKRAYERLEPNRDDIVVARYAGGLIVKRVVGLPGEELEVNRGRLFVNGARVPEHHSIFPGYLFVGGGKMLPGDYATLGDNRAVPAATAVHPIVTKADILGKVVLVLKL
jgi:signal peptidase I